MKMMRMRIESLILILTNEDRTAGKTDGEQEEIRDSTGKHQFGLPSDVQPQ